MKTFRLKGNKELLTYPIMAFSNILDISSFFIGMLINLLLIALICYYFKRKYETLEMAQNEQAKIIYNLIQQQQPRKQFNIEELMKNHVVENVNLDKIKNIELDYNSDSDSDSDSDTDMDADLKSSSTNEIKTIILDKVHTVDVDEISLSEVKSEEMNVEVDVEVDITTKSEDDYSKLTIKQLKDILSKKGISSNNKMKKIDLIQLIETGEPYTLNLSEELSEVNI